jgi:DNA-binding response OmpR family regulator
MNATRTTLCETPQSAARLLPEVGECRRRVLLIEDNEDAMFLVNFALTKFGDGQYDLIWAKTLYDGLLEASEDRVDVVLLDLGLPESTGSISYAWVRNQTQHVPIVVLTADEDEETKDAVIASGASNYLLKQSITGPLLVLAIEAALRGGRPDEVNDHPLQTAEGVRRVLLIEDDEDAMLLVRYALEEYGQGRFCTEWKTSLQAGIECLTAGDIDLVLLDVGLPDSAGVSGYIELHKAAPEVPVIVMTGSNCLELEFGILACGADDYLDKCLTSGSQLMHTIEAVLQEVQWREERERRNRGRPSRSVSNTFWGM